MMLEKQSTRHFARKGCRLDHVEGPPAKNAAGRCKALRVHGDDVLRWACVMDDVLSEPAQAAPRLILRAAFAFVDERLQHHLASLMAMPRARTDG